MSGVALSGATRLFMIVGDPIAQVRSPGGVSAAFAALGVDAICVPAQVATEDLGDFLSVCDRMKNLDGLIVTVPHKFACFRHCASASKRAGFIAATSIMRRRAEGGWHGDQFDGEGFVRAMRGKGVAPEGKRALLVGAGGAGSAIAYALIEAGVSVVAVHDADAGRRDALIGRIEALGRLAEVGSDDPTGFDLVCNASPAGMRAGDPVPVRVERLTSAMYVGCVITVPVVTTLIAAARGLGCVTGTGGEMYEALQHLMVDFLLAPMAAR
jgi:shikimate dehydrogenase